MAYLEPLLRVGILTGPFRAHPVQISVSIQKASQFPDGNLPFLNPLPGPWVDMSNRAPEGPSPKRWLIPALLQPSAQSCWLREERAACRGAVALSWFQNEFFVPAHLRRSRCSSRVSGTKLLHSPHPRGGGGEDRSPSSQWRNVGNGWAGESSLQRKKTKLRYSTEK